MLLLRFEWDEDKAWQNRSKHGVSFEEAETAFLDEDALLTADPDHSAYEDRFVLLGLSTRLRTLVVCHCYHHGEETIRIISARKANTAECAVYLRRRRR